MADDFSNSEKGIGPSASSSTKAPESQEDIPRTERNVPPLSSFLIDLICTVRRSLDEIVNQTQIYEKKYSDNGVVECFSRIRGDIAKIDVLFDTLLEYNKIVAPIRKTNTVHNLIEKILKKYQPVFEKRETLIFRRFEKDLPEVIVPDEQLRYILDSLLQYILGLIPSGGGISFSTRSLLIQEKEDERQPLLEQNTRWVEIYMIFTRYKSSMEKAKILLGMQEHQTNQDPSDLILQLAKKMVDKNKGWMKFELAEETNKSSISLLLPVEKEGSDLL
jgi:nitrogen-specific signal transduction histidine kinase